MSDSTSNEKELPDWLTENEPETDSSSLFAGGSSSGALQLNLKPGDRFPLRKVVEQELTQESLSGQQTPNRSRLEIMFAITVTEKELGRTKMAVKYDRVKYSHHVADEHVEFDSISPPVEIPIAVRAYNAMVGDGFSFWLGDKNQIVEVEGFNQFVDRCLQSVPQQYQRSVVLGMEAGSGDSGVANFIDNSIGLLPYGTSPNVGDHWEKRGVISKPVPMYADSVYTLKDLTDQYAVIDVRGTMTPSTSVSTIDDGNGVRVSITGGDTTGSCTIFRDTGLPRQSRIDRNVDMTVTMPNSMEFRQRKRVTTTIESFPATGTIATSAESTPANSFQQASFTAPPQSAPQAPSTPPATGSSVPTMQVTPPDLLLPGMVAPQGGTQSAQQPRLDGPAFR